MGGSVGENGRSGFGGVVTCELAALGREFGFGRSSLGGAVSEGWIIERAQTEKRTCFPFRLAFGGSGTPSAFMASVTSAGTQSRVSETRCRLKVPARPASAAATIAACSCSQDKAELAAKWLRLRRKPSERSALSEKAAHSCSMARCQWEARSAETDAEAGPQVPFAMATSLRERPEQWSSTLSRGCLAWSAL